MVTDNGFIRISNWLAFVKSLGYEIPDDVTSRSLRQAAADAIIPAEMVKNVWCVPKDQTDRIATTFGLKAPTPSKQAA